ncbi:MAG: hypothetical protein V5A43_03675 [Haloarculaceae archaeon]
MREEAEIRKRYEFLSDQLEEEETKHDGLRLADEEMNHDGIQMKMLTFYKRALGWALEEERM